MKILQKEEYEMLEDKLKEILDSAGIKNAYDEDISRSSKVINKFADVSALCTVDLIRKTEDLNGRFIRFATPQSLWGYVDLLSSLGKVTSTLISENIEDILKITKEINQDEITKLEEEKEKNLKKQAVIRAELGKTEGEDYTTSFDQDLVESYKISARKILSENKSVLDANLWFFEKRRKEQAKKNIQDVVVLLKEKLEDETKLLSNLYNRIEPDPSKLKAKDEVSIESYKVFLDNLIEGLLPAEHQWRILFFQDESNAGTVSTQITQLIQLRDHLNDLLRLEQLKESFDGGNWNILEGESTNIEDLTQDAANKLETKKQKEAEIAGIEEELELLKKSPHTDVDLQITETTRLKEELVNFKEELEILESTVVESVSKLVDTLISNARESSFKQVYSSIERTLLDEEKRVFENLFGKACFIEKDVVMQIRDILNKSISKLFDLLIDSFLDNSITDDAKRKQYLEAGGNLISLTFSDKALWMCGDRVCDGHNAENFYFNHDIGNRYFSRYVHSYSTLRFSYYQKTFWISFDSNDLVEINKIFLGYFLEYLVNDKILKSIDVISIADWDSHYVERSGYPVISGLPTINMTVKAEVFDSGKSKSSHGETGEKRIKKIL